MSCKLLKRFKLGVPFAFCLPGEGTPSLPPEVGLAYHFIRISRLGSYGVPEVLCSARCVNKILNRNSDRFTVPSSAALKRRRPAVGRKLISGLRASSVGGLSGAMEIAGPSFDSALRNALGSLERNRRLSKSPFFTRRCAPGAGRTSPLLILIRSIALRHARSNAPVKSAPRVSRSHQTPA